METDLFCSLFSYDKLVTVELKIELFKKKKIHRPKNFIINNKKAKCNSVGCYQSKL